MGSILKQNRILPNSYNKIPSDIIVSMDKDKRPMVNLEFKSTTSNSVREFMLFQDGAMQKINGVPQDSKNQNLIEIWKKFQERVKSTNEIELRRKGLLF